MKLLGTLILLALVLLAAFAALNWDVLTAPTRVSFGFYSLDAPLGVILLGFALAVAALLLGYAVLQRAALLLESRRHAQELRTQREIAERTEASRLEALRLQLERECAELRASIQECSQRQASSARDLEQALHKSLEEAANSLAAAIGQIDDKLDRSGRA